MKRAQSCRLRTDVVGEFENNNSPLNAYADSGMEAENGMLSKLNSALGSSSHEEPSSAGVSGAIGGGFVLKPFVKGGKKQAVSTHLLHGLRLLGLGHDWAVCGGGVSDPGKRARRAFGSF